MPDSLCVTVQTFSLFILKLTTFAESKVPGAHAPAPLCSSANIQPQAVEQSREKLFAVRS